MNQSDFPQAFAEALVREIKAEMGRKDIRSSRALGRIIGQSSPYMSDRLDGGSSKTGKRVVLNAKDIAAISLALDVTPEELVKRATEAVHSESLPHNVTQGPWKTSEGDIRLVATKDDNKSGVIDGDHTEG